MLCVCELYIHVQPCHQCCHQVFTVLSGAEVPSSVCAACSGILYEAVVALS